MKLFFTLIVAACCAGLAVPDLALAKSRNSVRAHQSSGSDQANDDRPQSGHTAGSKLPRQTAGKSPSNAKPASRGKAKSRAGSRAKRSAGAKPVRPDTGQAGIPAATQSAGAGGGVTPRVDRGDNARQAPGRDARSDQQKAPVCSPPGKSGDACTDAVRHNGSGAQRSEPTRNEQIRSTKALAKLYMHKAK